MQYITVKDHIITGHYCGVLPDEEEQSPGEEYIEVEDFAGIIGNDIRIYEDTETWQLRHLADLVEDGLIVIPEKQKLTDNGTAFVDMTTPELIEAGYLTLKPTEKIVNGEVIPKTKKELYDEGLITSAEYNEHIDTLRKAAYAAESDHLALEALRGEIEKETWFAKIAEIKEMYKKV